jgi:predicted ATP-dependent serine protease
MFRPLSQLLADAATEPVWLWDGFLAPGAVTLLYGPPKVGKSTLVYGLLGALALGQRFLDRATRPTSALILSEEPPEAMKAKLATFGGLETHHGVRRADLRALTWSHQIAGAAKYARTNRAGLIVVDTFGDLAGLRGEEENDAGAVQAALDPLKEVAERDGLSVLLIHHSRKSGGSHGTGVRGSSAFVAAVDTFAEVQRGGGGARRTLRYESRFRPEGSISLDLTEGGYVAVRSKEEEQTARILAVLGAGGVQSIQELEEATNIPRTTLQRKLAKLHELRLIEPAGEAVSRGNPQLWVALAAVA